MQPLKCECAECAIQAKVCRSPEGQAPPFCPGVVDAATIENAIREYEKSETSGYRTARDNELRMRQRAEDKTPLARLSREHRSAFAGDKDNG